VGAWSALLPPVLVFSRCAYGRGVPRTYPARHAPALDIHGAMHATSPRAVWSKYPNALHYYKLRLRYDALHLAFPRPFAHTEHLWKPSWQG